VRALVVVAVIAASLGLGGSTPPVSAYSAVDLPATPTYCHPNIPGSGWVQDDPSCSIPYEVDSSYACCDEDGLIEYGGPVFNTVKQPVTAFGNYSAPPRFTLTAKPGPWPDDGKRRVMWLPLNFSYNGGPSFSASPLTPCAEQAMSCTYQWDPGLNSVVSGGLGSPPKWLKAVIGIQVLGSSGQCCFYYGFTSIAVGFYRTDNRPPVAVLDHYKIGAPGDVSYHFDARNSFDRDNDKIVRYVWEFGDGTTAEGIEVDHTYAEPGSYQPQLFAIDSQGAQGTDFENLGTKITMTSLTVSSLPKKVGDEFDVTATVRNDSSDTISCMHVRVTPDIRPASSFTKLSGPTLPYDNNLVPRGGTVSATWRMKLTGPTVPGQWQFFADSFGGGFGGCPGSEPGRSYLFPTFYIRAPAPFASWAAMVARQYADLVGRAPTASESSTWVAKLTNGTARPEDLATALRTSAENTSNVDPVARLYRAFLQRIPDSQGLTYWINRKRSGSWSLAKIADYFAKSNEFKTKYGSLSNKAFVTRIYTDVLGRTADPSGVTYWTKQLDAGTRTRGSVMIGFSESNEYKRNQVQNVDVAVAYALLLGRAPTASEADEWNTSDRQDGLTPTALLAEILASAAYATRVAG
jgi:PKD repeat protein